MQTSTGMMTVTEVAGLRAVQAGHTEVVPRHRVQDRLRSPKARHRGCCGGGTKDVPRIIDLITETARTGKMRRRGKIWVSPGSRRSSAIPQRAKLGADAPLILCRCGSTERHCSRTFSITGRRLVPPPNSDPSSDAWLAKACCRTRRAASPCTAWRWPRVRGVRARRAVSPERHRPHVAAHGQGNRRRGGRSHLVPDLGRGAEASATASGR